MWQKKQPNEPFLVKRFYRSRVLSTTMSRVNESNDTNRSTGCVDLKRFDADDTFVRIKSSWKFASVTLHCGMVPESVERWTWVQEIEGRTAIRAPLHSNLEQVILTRASSTKQYNLALA